MASANQQSTETSQADTGTIFNGLHRALSALSADDRKEVLRRLDEVRTKDEWIKPGEKAKTTDGASRARATRDTIADINRANAKHWGR